MAWWRLIPVAIIAAGLVLLRRGLAGAKPTGPRRVATLGDSITAAGVYTRDLLPLLPLGSTVRAFGYGGQQVRAIHGHLPEVLAWNPTDVVVLAGVNDLASGRSSGHVLRDLAALWTDASAGARVIAVTILPWAGWRTVANRYVAGGLPFGEQQRAATEVVNRGILASSIPAVAVDTNPAGDQGGRLRAEYDSGDGLHLNAAGHAALARLIAAAAF